MRLLVCCLGVSIAAYAGVIKGVVLEHASGRPLARALVRLEPLSQSSGQPLQVRAGRSGEFVFHSVQPGLYHMLAQRTGYFPLSYGQRRPAGYGQPLQVTSDTEVFAELRMRRLGAISGTVLDENGIGLAGVEVVAYRAALPLQIAKRGTSDDRGVYRITGLDIGKYWVRTASHTLEDGTGLLPTFSPQSREIRDARIYETTLDTDTTDAKIYPESGPLFHLRGAITCDRANSSVNVILSSETGRRTMQAGCQGEYSFDGLAPAAYEVFASYPDRNGSGFAEILLRRDEILPVQVGPLSQVDFVATGSSGAANSSALVLRGRRQDLSGAEMLRDIPFPRAALDAGHWEFISTAGSDQYVQAITGSGRDFRRSRPERPPEWHEVFIEPRIPARVQISVSDKAASLSGVVMSDGRGIAGAPVYVWPVNEATRRITGGPRPSFSDAHGAVRFEGLPPGDYRLLATFDYREITLDVLEEAQARTIRLEAAQRATVDLPLWTAP